jgi:hypothetical protein
LWLLAVDNLYTFFWNIWFSLHLFILFFLIVSCQLILNPFYHTHIKLIQSTFNINLILFLLFILKSSIFIISLFQLWFLSLRLFKLLYFHHSFKILYFSVNHLLVIYLWILFVYLYIPIYFIQNINKRIFYKLNLWVKN